MLQVNEWKFKESVSHHIELSWVYPWYGAGTGMGARSGGRLASDGTGGAAAASTSSLLYISETKLNKSKASTRSTKHLLARRRVADGMRAKLSRVKRQSLGSPRHQAAVEAVVKERGTRLQTAECCLRSRLGPEAVAVASSGTRCLGVWTAGTLLAGSMMGCLHQAMVAAEQQCNR